MLKVICDWIFIFCNNTHGKWNPVLVMFFFFLFQECISVQNVRNSSQQSVPYKCIWIDTQGLDHFNVLAVPNGIWLHLNLAFTRGIYSYIERLNCLPWCNGIFLKEMCDPLVEDINEKFQGGKVKVVAIPEGVCQNSRKKMFIYRGRGQYKISGNS